MDGLHRVVWGFDSRIRIPIEMGTKDAGRFNYRVT